MPQVAGRKQAGREPGWGQSQWVASLGERATPLAVAESSMSAKMIAADSLFINPDKIQREQPGRGPVEPGGIFSLQFFSGAASFLRHGWLNDDHIWSFFNRFFQ